MRPSDILAQTLDGWPNFILAVGGPVNAEGQVPLTVPGRPFAYQSTGSLDSVNPSDNLAGFQFEGHEESFSFTGSCWSAQ